MSATVLGTTKLEILAAEVVDLGVTLEDAERNFRRVCISSALRWSGGNRGEAARRLGIHRNTLMRMARRLGVTA